MLIAYISLKSCSLGLAARIEKWASLDNIFKNQFNISMRVTA